ncbi:MAG: LysR substrate-binding domain-containing protein [Epibacterium sp.]
MNIELADLRLFVMIAECGNLTHGAARAFLSPPAASARIKAMEQEIGQQLLVRKNKGVELTPSGDALLRHARLVLRQFDFLTDDMTNAQMGHLRIYANTTGVTEFLPAILARFLADHPGVRVDLQERLTQEIIRAVADGTADIGIISGTEGRDGLERLRFATDRLMLAVPSGHPMAHHDQVSLEQTLAFEHIALHDGSTLLDFLRRQLRRSAFDRQLRIQVRSFEAMCRLIEAGVGIGVVPESAALRHLQTMDIALLALADDWAVRDRSILVRRWADLPQSAQRLIDLLVEKEAGGAEV